MSAFSFTDLKGRTYNVRVTFRTIFDVARILNLDLLNPGVEQNGILLSEELLTSPTLVVKIVAALCDVDDVDDFYDSIDGAVYAKLEEAFWNAYGDFFTQAGRDWLTVAIQKSLDLRTKNGEITKAGLLGLRQSDSSNSSPEPESTAGKTDPSGNSPSSETPSSESSRPSSPKSTPRSTTRTRSANKTSDLPASSTSTNEAGA